MAGLHSLPGGREVQAGQRRRQQQHDHARHHQGEDHRRGRVQGGGGELPRDRREVLHVVCVRSVRFIILNIKYFLSVINTALH